MGGREEVTGKGKEVGEMKWESGRSLERSHGERGRKEGRGRRQKRRSRRVEKERVEREKIEKEKKM